MPDRVVFIDETAAKTNLTRLHGRANRGERLTMDAPFGNWGTETLIAGLTADALIAPGTVVIFDNLAMHDHGCWLLFLPLYSPDLNPIEQAFSKLKAHLRRIGAKTFTDVYDAIGNICDLYEPNECWNNFKAARYVAG